MGFKSPVDVLKQGIAKIGAGPYDKDAVVKVVDGYTSGSRKVVVFSWTRRVNRGWNVKTAGVAHTRRNIV